MQPLAKSREAGFAAQRRRHLIIRNSIRRCANVCLSPIGKNLAINISEAGVLECLGTSARSASPDAHQPNVSETQPLPLGKFRLWHSGESDRLSRLVRKLAQPDASI